MTPQDDTSTRHTDDIIELTDIIEKGTVPPAADSVDFDKELEDLFADSDIASAISNLDLPDDMESRPAGPASSPSDDLDDLNNDIDAFLDALDAPDTQAAPGHKPSAKPDQKAQAATPAPPSATGARPVNPNEELQMPDMSDMDNLLEQLDAPASSPHTGDIEDLDAGDLDSILDDILGGGAKPAAHVAPAAAAAPAGGPMSLDDIDALLDAAPRPATPTAPESPEIPEELEVPEAHVAPAAAAAPAGGPMSLDDIDALLDAAPRPATPAAPESPEIPEELEVSEAHVAPAAAAAMAVAGAVSAPESVATVNAEALEGLLERLRALEAEVEGLRAAVAHGDGVAAALEERLAALDDAEHGTTPAEPVAPDAEAVGRVLSNMLAEGHPSIEWLVEQIRAVVMNGMSEHLENAVERSIERAVTPLREAVTGADAAAEGLIELDNRLSALEASRITGDDIAALENALREALRDETDKAAAEAAARVIREEIAALAEVL